ncbi:MULTISPECIES: DUF1289 domain-containing protein [unclassified Pseudomonas]|uniref:DUF1289 domain-containing protein n=1 Tax=unclassified Pseudomonas TaxID=196821 RepID=UPI002449B4C7|nr:DUF1289 domain-containing protein [Pseudomonas sp. GD03944]MDH1263974.1 DUF1289 domain-containing protein [Pseudomonas sp. GD03944]
MNSTNSETPPSETVASPCRRACCLDERDICLGCGRALSEILEWGTADNPRRRAICQSAQARLEAH